MSTGLLERTPQAPPAERVSPRTSFQAVHAAVVPRIIVHADFDCPWSYLASRRAAVLAGAGVEIDWRAVEREPRAARRSLRDPDRFEILRQEMDRVVASLLPGELLPYDLAGFVPRTRSTVAAYAESYAAGAADAVRRVVFESFWMHGVDIGDAKVLRTLLVDHLRSSASPTEVVRAWGYPVDVTGGPISTTAWRLVGRWATEWRDTDREVTPVVKVPGSPPVHGVEAVSWLGAQITERGLAPQPPPPPGRGQPDARELPDLGWITEQGGRWLPRRQRLASARRSTTG